MSDTVPPRALADAALNQEPVEGLTHRFYRYPARFSPKFVGAALEHFSSPGDLVLDPFLGGGTTLVEARVLGRPAVGVDLSELAIFVSRVKTTLLSRADIAEIREWTDGIAGRLNLRNPAVSSVDWVERGYHRNIDGRRTWAIRKSLELGLAELGRLNSTRSEALARCALLRTGQWALDCRSSFPTARDFRNRLERNLRDMTDSVLEFTQLAKTADQKSTTDVPIRTLCLSRSAVGLESAAALWGEHSPRLILTSPPYPGIHILYHRWQILGRRETPAPFWIAGCTDGHGASYYTLGHREQPCLVDYFRKIEQVFSSLRRLSDSNTVVVQMIAFSDLQWQLPKYLGTMEQAGFVEFKLPEVANADDGRLWRTVPNRKWYASRQEQLHSRGEVVLFHRPV